MIPVHTHGAAPGTWPGAMLCSPSSLSPFWTWLAKFTRMIVVRAAPSSPLVYRCCVTTQWLPALECCFWWKLDGFLDWIFGPGISAIGKFCWDHFRVKGLCAPEDACFHRKNVGSSQLTLWPGNYIRKAHVVPWLKHGKQIRIIKIIIIIKKDCEKKSRRGTKVEERECKTEEKWRACFLL